MSQSRQPAPRKRKSASPKTKPRKEPSRKSAFWGFLGKGSLAVLVGLMPLLIYLDARVTHHFEGRKWTLPSRVWSAPVLLDEANSRADLDWLLQQAHYREASVLSEPGDMVHSAEGVRLYRRAYQVGDESVGPREFFVAIRHGRIHRIYAGGIAVSDLDIEPLEIGGIYPGHREDRILVSLEEVPDFLVQALVATEDKRFYEHHGISLRGILRAVVNNIRNRKLAQGGSTITQQLVKNFFLTPERTLRRKLVEIPMALLLEWHYSKDEILETYLNEVYLGQDGSRAIHGIGLAARFYFGKPVDALTLDEAALLVGLIRGPSWYDPRRHPERARQRRNLVLDELAEEQRLSSRELLNAKAAPIRVLSQQQVSQTRYPAYLQLVKQQLAERFSVQANAGDSLRIDTGFNPLIQQKAEQALAEGLQALENQFNETGLQGAAVVVEVETGNVVALVGDRHPRFEGFNRALDARRSIGSLAKPVVYLTALQQGLHPLSPVSDKPFSILVDNQQVWQPRNYDHQSHGQPPEFLVPLREAMGHSYNQATARLGIDMGLERVVDNFLKLGVSRVQPYPSIMLGAVQLAPIEVAQMYQTIASGGFYRPLRAPLAVTGSHRHDYFPLAGEARFDARNLWLLRYLLHYSFAEGTGRRIARQMPDDRFFAGKTGTTDDLRDSWYAGFGQRYVTVVWVGKDDNSPTALTGATGALPIWARIMASLEVESVLGEPPEGVQWAWLDRHTLALSGPGCGDVVRVPLRSDALPAERTACGEVLQVPQKLRHWWRKLFR